ncbi:hypothetical protein [Peptostreptococcus anaerobius]
MSSSIIAVIEDLLDQYEDSVYNHEDSYKINEHRNKISFVLNELLKKDENEIKELAENREIEKIYRLVLDEYDMPTTAFYTSKKRALEELEEFKEKITEEYIDTEQIDVGVWILIQEIDLNKSEDLHMYSTSKIVSELAIDEGASAKEWLDLV